ncbi:MULTISPECIES: Get3/ArsA fold putative tail anchor-mediating ATPase NosAFP [Arthrospira]|jgi:arsenite-transporting ATPase|uniref:Anion-transporting ATPase n=1 Tax=Limnospira platensis NIES-46 TaxID=1236695 RepID=A0A5M3TAR9_LIMPL|nr:ArsA family ATPase [Arthrospira platensis]AMW31402.1 arsenic-transporting ATPase [Arthrospira platensis YZ]KDR56137.1 ABC transporter ATPase [Arthrospira platensis str. Paraca]MBD2671270.1 ArsA family ATPase [Arthrospira platensis FACHB-439]MBD2712237.1 ArsA family ATPase [Arthrospira platensis FACHB-835]MDF2208896.1 ArsA family ATPase [Arthrospira platensis NCB002]MDT9184841.1 ArsA family ATPase [Limnospira sp. PMC 289.06]MDT9297454.1 ArsA family ATPase [Arthrospira platensis PCC 7345]M
MAVILTFLGKGGTGRSTIAIAAAKGLAAEGKRVLLATSDSGPAPGLLLGTKLTTLPTPVETNLKAVQFQCAALLESSWEQVKTIEAQYLRTPFFKNVYGQELGVLPGMDSALALNALREYDNSGDYDAIVYDGNNSQETLRMLGMPEILSWYIRRFRQVFLDSDLGKALSPFVQPIASTVLSVDISGDTFAGPTKEMSNVLEQGKSAVSDPNRVSAYLVTTEDEVAQATASYLWGSAQQVGLTVGGILLNRSQQTSYLADSFAPLTVTAIPEAASNWETLIKALPDFSGATSAPRSISIDVARRHVTLFLPGFDKKQIKLTQYGPELTIEAGDQRRNILLPPSLTGQPVTGAKFQNGYLIVSL